MKNRYFRSAALGACLWLINPPARAETKIEGGDAWKACCDGKTAASESAPKWGGSVSAGFDSKYIFRGTNLTPHSDGVIWIEGSVSAHPWDGGTFTVGMSFRSQIGNAEFGRVPQSLSNVPGFVAPPPGGTNYDLRVPEDWIGLFEHQGRVGPQGERAITSAFNETFRNRGELEFGEVLDFLKQEYFLLSGGRSFSEFHLPVYPYVDRFGGTQFDSAEALGYGPGIKDSLRASGYRGKFPSQITRFESERNFTQREFREFNLSFSYRQELGPVALRVTNTLSYTEQELNVLETFREVFASDTAREFTDFETRISNYFGFRINPGVDGGNPGFLPVAIAPALPVGIGKPEEILFNGGREETRRYRIHAEEMVDRLDLELSANTGWLLEEGHTWARYFWPRITYSQTLYNDVDTGDITLPSYPNDERGSYLAAELNGHVPLIRSRADSLVPIVSRSPENPLPWRDVLSIDVTTLLSASFGDRPDGNAGSVRGWQDFEVRGELNWWPTPSCRIAPSVSYATLFSDPIPGASDSAFWYAVKCEYIF